MLDCWNFQGGEAECYHIDICKAKTKSSVRQALVNVEANDTWWVDLCRMLCVPLNMSKHQRCKQTMGYLGFLYDSFGCLMQCLAQKLMLLRAHSANLSTSAALWLLRDLDRIKSQILHYSATFASALPTCSASWVRSEGLAWRLVMPSPYAQAVSAHYDRPDPPRQATQSSPRRWTPDANCSLQAARHAALAANCLFCVHGPALLRGNVTLLRTHVGRVACRLGGAGALVGAPAPSGLCRSSFWSALGLQAGTSASNPSMRHSAGPTPLRASQRQWISIRGNTCVLRNDAAAATAFFIKGSTQSTLMQH